MPLPLLQGQLIYFQVHHNVEKNLETLIDFVQEPYFTEKTVEKEKGIIGQEITMYDDNPDWRLYFGLIENMYQNHPVNIDIAGTIESISHITKDMFMNAIKLFIIRAICFCLSSVLLIRKKL